MDSIAREKVSRTAFVLAMISLLAWIIPIIGVPVSTAGLYYAGKTSDNKAFLAFVICIVTLLASGINGYIGYQQ